MSFFISEMESPVFARMSRKSTSCAEISPESMPATDFANPGLTTPTQSASEDEGQASAAAPKKSKRDV